MLGKNPLDVPDKKLDELGVVQALRLAIIAELDAINLYVQLANAIKDEKIKKVFLDVAKEEKTHVGEFLELLMRLDPEQVEEIKKGKEEIEELLSGE